MVQAGVTMVKIGPLRVHYVCVCMQINMKIDDTRLILKITNKDSPWKSRYRRIKITTHRFRGIVR